jgi:hypothetical protein
MRQFICPLTEAQFNAEIDWRDTSYHAPRPEQEIM